MVHNSEPESPLKCSAHVDNGNRVVTRIETGDVSLLYNVQLRRRSALSAGASTGEWGPKGAPYRVPVLISGDQTGCLYRGSGSKWVSIQGACSKKWGPNRAPLLRNWDQMGHLYRGFWPNKSLYWGVWTKQGTSTEEWGPNGATVLGIGAKRETCTQDWGPNRSLYRVPVVRSGDQKRCRERVAGCQRGTRKLSDFHM